MPMILRGERFKQGSKITAIWVVLRPVSFENEPIGQGRHSSAPARMMCQMELRTAAENAIQFSSRTIYLQICIEIERSYQNCWWRTLHWSIARESKTKS
jgi:hypothetical protein